MSKPTLQAVELFLALECQRPIVIEDPKNGTYAPSHFDSVETFLEHNFGGKIRLSTCPLGLLNTRLWDTSIQ